jgi:hypothetical protein
VLIRLLILCVVVILVSLVLRLNRRFEAAPPWLRILHHTIFYSALAFVVVSAAIFMALHVFGYRL